MIIVKTAENGITEAGHHGGKNSILEPDLSSIQKLSPHLPALYLG